MANYTSTDESMYCPNNLLLTMTIYIPTQNSLPSLCKGTHCLASKSVQPSAQYILLDLALSSCQRVHIFVME